MLSELWRPLPISPYHSPSPPPQKQPPSLSPLVLFCCSRSPSTIPQHDFVPLFSGTARGQPLTAGEDAGTDLPPCPLCSHPQPSCPSRPPAQPGVLVGDLGHCCGDFRDVMGGAGQRGGQGGPKLEAPPSWCQQCGRGGRAEADGGGGTGGGDEQGALRSSPGA